MGAVGAAGAAMAGVTAWWITSVARPGASGPDRGDLRWRFPTAGTVLSRPRVAGDLIYAASNDGTLYAVATATGQEAWRFGTGAALGSSPLVHGGVVYLGSDEVEFVGVFVKVLGYPKPGEPSVTAPFFMAKSLRKFY